MYFQFVRLVRVAGVAIVLSLFAVTSPAWSAQLAYDWRPIAQNGVQFQTNNSSANMGMRFLATADNMEITKLGFWGTHKTTAASSVTPNNMTVRLYEYNAGDPASSITLATAVILQGTASDETMNTVGIGNITFGSEVPASPVANANAYLWVQSIAPITLTQGKEYMIAAEGFSSSLFHLINTTVGVVHPVEAGSGLQQMDNRFNSISGGVPATLDSNPDYNTNAYARYSVTFEYSAIPEPASGALSLMGLAACGLLVRRRK